MSQLVLVPEIPGKLVHDLRYATQDNFTGQPIYTNALCYLHEQAFAKLQAALDIAVSHGFGLCIFDAFRPQEAQQKLWDICPDPNFIAPPEKGSPHSRGVAVDLTLFELNTGKHLDMGTAFDAFTPLSYHGNRNISPAAEKNRLLFLGIMTTAGWDFFRNEWWHYQLFDSRSYSLISDAELPHSMLT
jgi:D-alanyl-D-alanine dipeptidase